MSLHKLDDMELLRLVTVGSVDDGKSTLIGRLLFDTKGAFEDQLLAIRKKGAASDSSGDDLLDEEVDLAMLTDGLQAEREQGITIDVAYRYFATEKRKFIMADCPGHEQYTRNMVTGASTATAAIILIDARKGVLPQTRRHSLIAGLLGIPHLIVAINKMDLVEYSESVFNTITAELADFCRAHGVHDLICIPISALKGDMVVKRGDAMPWYGGRTVLETLEALEVNANIDDKAFRFPVQLVNRPQGDELHDFRGFMGRIASGTVKVGETIVSLPSGMSSRIKQIITYENELAEAFAPMSVTITLEDEIDVSRGSMFVRADQMPRSEKSFSAMVCWMDVKPLAAGSKVLIKHTTNTIKAIVSAIEYRLDINTLEQQPVDSIQVNDIARLTFKLQQPMMFDSYADNPGTGNFIVIDSFTNNTVGAGMII